MALHFSTQELAARRRRACRAMAPRGLMVDAALNGFCRTEDASDLVRLLRLVKSPAELRYVRRAGKLADEALAVANRMTVPGAPVGGIYAGMLGPIVAGDGDPS